MSHGMTRAERLDEMKRLYVQRAFSDIEMAERLGVDRTTAYRDRIALTTEYPFRQDDFGRWRIDRARYISEIKVNLHEALALYLAARRASRQTRIAQPHVANALEKLAVALKQPMTERLVGAARAVLEQSALPERVKTLETIAQAWVEQRKVRITHRALRSQRSFTYLVSPYLIEPSLWSDGVYLIGFSDVHQDLTTFKIERIERAELTQESFTIPETFDEQELFKHAWGIWYGENDPLEIKVRFTGAEAIRRLKESVWHPTQQIEDDGGACIWTARVAEWQEMLPWIRGWGADCEVLEPNAMREALKRDARQLAKVYEIVLAERNSKQYYAHSKENCDESEWQLLKNHLIATGDLAFELGRDAGISELARLAGILHDIGKYSQPFQDRLRGSKRPVDHATAGAREVVKLFPGNPFAELLSYCIAGHHSGLPDYGDPTDLPGAPTLLARREKKQLEDYSFYRTELDPEALALLTVPLKPMPAHPGFTVSFLTRMIFSTLVDADWVETETSIAGRPKPRGGHASLDTLLEQFNTYIKRFEKSQGTVNQKRGETLQACVEKARLKPGLFSLTVPTGGGKTLASLAFALNHAVQHGMKRIIYVIPFTSIIEQNATIFKDALGEENVLEHHSNFDWEGLKRRDPPANPDDETNQVYDKLKLASENWDIPIVVTTNVQFFESLFANKKSRARKVHNIAKSVIVFDEAQMLPREYLKPCMLAVWELVQNYRTTAVFCTATQPNLQPFFPDVQMSELVPDPQALFDFYQRVQIRSLGKLPDADLTQRLNAHRQALCVVNTRRHAKGLFDLLEDGGRFHLSTLMCPVHRQEVLLTIRQRLQAGKVCRVVSTQVIEAGVDIDFPAGYRALAGLDSIIQAAGRVNRERRNLSGEVYVFEPETDLIRRTPAFIAQTSRAGASILREFGDDPTSLQAIQAYFLLLDTLQDPERSADVKKILAYLDKEKFDFAKAGENFRLIESPTLAVVIPFDETGRDLLEKLRYSLYPAGFARRLQRYTVSIYEPEFQALQAKGAIDTYHDIFFVLNEMAYYDKQTGLALLADRGGEAIFFD